MSDETWEPPKSKDRFLLFAEKPGERDRIWWRNETAEDMICPECVAEWLREIGMGVKCVDHHRCAEGREPEGWKVWFRDGGEWWCGGIYEVEANAEERKKQAMRTNDYDEDEVEIRPLYGGGAP